MKVYIVEDTISGLNVDTEVTVKAFSTEEKAIEYRNKLEKDYIHDYQDFVIKDSWIHYFTMVGNNLEDDINVIVYPVEVDEKF